MSNDQLNDSSPRLGDEVFNGSNDGRVDVDDYSGDVYNSVKLEDIVFDDPHDYVNKDNYQEVDEIEEIVYKRVEGKCLCNDLSVFKIRFWDLWLQKLLRNLASVKVQLMISFYWFVVYGMFFAKDQHGDPIIGAIAGLSFLGGGFVSIATARLMVKSSLFEHEDEMTRIMNTDR